MDDEDVLATLSDDFVFLPLSDFTSILKPADLSESRDEEISASVKHYCWFSGQTDKVGVLTLMFSLETSHSNRADSFSLTSTSWSGLVNST